ncbi:hypothetical protein K1719_017823 [Acacia pycnantha]|nr:hypothetical protein K1719_017823 [Acacia pycnantha]
MIYTDAIFKKFQLEILGVLSCQLQKEREDSAIVTFQTCNAYHAGVWFNKHSVPLYFETMDEKCKDTYQVAFQALEEVYKQCVIANNSVKSISEPNNSVLNGAADIEEENHLNHTTKTTKKRKSSNKRGCSESERTNIRTLDTFQNMEQMNTRAHNFDNCYIPRQDTETVDLDSRALTLDSCYEDQMNSVSHVQDGYDGNQPAALRLGQLHSVPSRSHHYQSMQGLGQLSLLTSTIHGSFDLQENLDEMEQLPAGESQFHRDS